METVLDRQSASAEVRRSQVPPGDAALVRVGPALCAMPHATSSTGTALAHPFMLRRIVPWRLPTPIPNNPTPMVLGVAPLGDEEGIERVELVVDLAPALGLTGSSGRDRRSCILMYTDGDLVVGFAVDALLRRVCPEDPWLPVPSDRDLPFVRGLRTFAPASPEAETPAAEREWRLVDVEALIGHLLSLLRVQDAATP